MSTPLTDVAVGAKINELTSNYFRRRKALKAWKQSLSEGKSSRDSARSAITVAATRPNDVVGTENRVTRAMAELKNETTDDARVNTASSTTGSTTLQHGSHAASSDNRKSLIIAGIVGFAIGVVFVIFTFAWVSNSYNEVFGGMGTFVTLIYVIVTTGAFTLMALYLVDRRNSVVVDSTTPIIVGSSEPTSTDGLTILNPPRP